MFLHHHGKVKLLTLTGIYSEFSGREIDLGDSLHHELYHALASLNQTLPPTDILVLNHLLSDTLATNVLTHTDHFAVKYSAT